MHTSGISYDALSTAQRNLLVNPNSGLTIYNKDNGQLEINLGSPSVPNWQPVVPGSLDTNTWDYPLVSFVSPTTGSSFGQLGDGNKPFQTIAQANASGASTIILLPGTYSGITVLESKTYVCLPGVLFPPNSRIRDNGIAIDCRILGDAIFGSFSYGFDLTAPSTIYCECLRFENTRQVCFMINGGDVHIKAKEEIFTNCVNGAGYPVTIRQGAKILIETPKLRFNYSFVYPVNGPNEFTLRCPDITMLNGGSYGNIYKTICNMQGVGAGENKMVIDLQGGKYKVEQAVQSVSFGVRDSACCLFVNQAVTDNTTMLFENGKIEANALLGVLVEYIVLSGRITFDNIKMSSNSKAIEMSQRAYNGTAGPFELVTNNCKIESGLDIELGNGKVARFNETDFTVKTGVSVFTFNNANSALPGEAYFTGCKAVLTSGPGETLTNFTGKIIGLLDTYGNQVIGVGAVDVYGVGGFTQVPTLTLPTFEL